MAKYYDYSQVCEASHKWLLKQALTQEREVHTSTHPKINPLHSPFIRCRKVSWGLGGSGREKKEGINNTACTLKRCNFPPLSASASPTKLPATSLFSLLKFFLTYTVHLLSSSHRVPWQKRPFMSQTCPELAYVAIQVQVNSGGSLEFTRGPLFPHGGSCHYLDKNLGLCPKGHVGQFQQKCDN